MSLSSTSPRLSPARSALPEFLLKLAHDASLEEDLGRHYLLVGGEVGEKERRSRELASPTV